MEEFQVPNRRDDLLAKGAIIRDKQVYSPTLGRQVRSAPLNFAKEVSLYKDRVLSNRHGAHRDVIDAISLAMDFAPGTRIICCILCHAKEDTESFNLEGLVDCVAAAGGHTVIFVNGADGGDTTGIIEQAATRLRGRFVETKSHDRISVVTNLFPKREPLSTIRGILADGVTLAAERAGLSDPIITSNDIDIVAVPNDYARITLEEFRSPKIDILSGPVFYGYDQFGRDYTGLPLSAPELMLGNRAIYCRKMALASGAMLGDPFFPTDGPNIAFRLSAYCAAGGYNYAVDVGEDTYIGSAIFGIRSETEDLFPQYGHASYNSAFWVATDPRRQLLSICSGNSIEDSWSFVPFSSTLGSSMKTAELARIYRNNDDMIQLGDIAELDGSLLQDKIRQRAITVFQESIRNDNFPETLVTYLARFYGLNRGEFNSAERNYDLSRTIIDGLKSCHGGLR